MFPQLRLRWRHQSRSTLVTMGPGTMRHLYIVHLAWDSLSRVHGLNCFQSDRKPENTKNLLENKVLKKYLDIKRLNEKGDF